MNSSFINLFIRHNPVERLSDEITATMARIVKLAEKRTITREDGDKIQEVVSDLIDDRSIAKISHDIWHIKCDHGLREEIALLSGLFLRYYGLAYFPLRDGKMIQMRKHLSEFGEKFQHQITFYSLPKRARRMLES